MLGSGLSGVRGSVRDARVVDFSSLDGLPAPTVQGHSGQFAAGWIADVPVLAQVGRYHYYEGVGAEVVSAPIRIGRALGARVLLLTNAAGGIRADLAPGALMRIADQLLFNFPIPRRAPIGEAMTDRPRGRPLHDEALGALAHRTALELGESLRAGVYGAMLGPNFETPAEIRMLERCGVDAVGMSTAPEAMTAAALGSRVLAISMISNRAAGLSAGPLTHEEVMREGARAGLRLGRILRELVPRIAASGALGRRAGSPVARELPRNG